MAIKIFFITILICLGYGLYDQYQLFTLFMRSNNNRSLENIDNYIFDTSSISTNSNVRLNNAMIRSDTEKHSGRTIKNDDTDHRYEPNFIHGGKALADPFGTIVHTVKSDNDDNTNTNIESFNNPRNRTLVIVWGSIRGGENVWETLYKNVLDTNNADLALMIGDIDPIYDNSTLLERAKYYWKFNEYNDWGDVIDILNHNDSTWRDTLFPMIPNDTYTGVLGGVKHAYYGGSGAIAYCIRYYIMHAIMKYKLREKYDHFIITRSDQYYLCEHNINEVMIDDKDTNAAIYVPYGENYKGICDRYAIISSKHVYSILDLLQSLLFHTDVYKEWLLNERCNPETILLTTITDVYKINPYTSISRFPRIMFTAYNAQYDDKTSLIISDKKKNSLQIIQPENVRVKYIKEYYGSKATCSSSSESSRRSTNSHQWINEVCQYRPNASFCYNSNNNNIQMSSIAI